MTHLFKLTGTSIALGISLFAGGVNDGSADVYAVITSKQSLESTDTLSRVIGKLANAKLQQNDTVLVYDGTTRRLISTIKIPDGARYQEGKFRLSYLKKRFRKIAKFIKSSCAETSANADNNLIALFRGFGDNVRSSYSDEKLHVLMYAPALHHDSRESSLSMRDGAYPNDGSFSVDGFASSYGVADRAQSFKGTTFHFCSVRDQFINEAHRDIVHRVWSLYIAKQGGSLATFTDDGALCRERFLSGSATSRAFIANPHPKPPAMIQFQQAQATIESANTEQPQQRLEFAQAGRFLSDDIPVNENSAVNTVGRIKVGVRWDCDCDLDLYVWQKGNSKPLYFGNAESEEGHFFKDWRSSPDNEKAHEYVDFFKPVDALDLKLSVNFYSGTAPNGVNGTVRIWLEGQDGVWKKSFHIPATKGNSGKHPANSKHWVSITPASVLDVASVAGTAR